MPAPITLFLASNTQPVNKWGGTSLKKYIRCTYGAARGFMYTLHVRGSYGAYMHAI